MICSYKKEYYIGVFLSTQRVATNLSKHFVERKENKPVPYHIEVKQSREELTGLT